MIWCNMLRIWILSLIVLNVFVSSESPSVWLLKPNSRSEEQNPDTKRLPESMCPTPQNPSDQITLTDIESGTFAEIQWNNPQQIKAHSSKIEILTAESTNGILTKLNSGNDSVFDAETGTTTKLVEIPENLSCRSCVLRLTLDLDTETQIVSCADVRILSAKELQKLQNETLAAIKPEITLECQSDADCTHGECHKGFCFCTNGYFGLNCLNVSKTGLNELNSDLKYNTFTFPNQKTQLLWRQDTPNNAIEYAIRYHVAELSSTDLRWIALGFRSANNNSQSKCQNLITKYKSYVMNTTKAQGTVIKNENRIVNSIFENNQEKPKNALNIRKIEIDCGPNEKWSAFPEYNRECEPSCDWTAFPESIPVCPQTFGTPRCVCAEGFVRKGNDKDECKPYDYCQAPEVVKEECALNQTWAKCGAACEPSCETMYNSEPCKSTCQDPACTYLEERFLFTTGAEAPNNTSKIPKSFLNTSFSSINTSNLQTVIEHANETASCPKNETLNECGRVCEADCLSVFVREECSSCGAASCACQQGYARLNGECVYWGDCPVEGESTFSCQTEYRFPEGCQEDACVYLARWKYNPADDDVHFEISSKGIGRWTGIGFSLDSGMANSDVYTGWVYDGKAYVTDRFAFDKQLPAIDSSNNQDIYNVSAKINDDIQVFYSKKISCLDYCLQSENCNYR